MFCDEMSCTETIAGWFDLTNAQWVYQSYTL